MDMNVIYVGLDVGHGEVKQVLIISVNAATHHYPGWGREPEPPNIKKVRGAWLTY